MFLSFEFEPDNCTGLSRVSLTVLVPEKLKAATNKNVTVQENEEPHKVAFALEDIRDPNRFTSLP